MIEQEVEHLDTFDALINERKVRPSFLDPVLGGCRVYAWLNDCGNGTKGGHGMHNCCRRGDWRTLSEKDRKSWF